MHTVWISYILVHILTLTSGYTYTEMNNLLEHLFNATRYNKFLRPLENQTSRITVEFSQYLKSVEHFDISTGEVIVTGFFEISWKDEFLIWDPYLYGQNKIIQLPKGKFWKPEFDLLNGRANEESSIYSNGPFLAWVTYNGNVLLTPGGTYQARCNIDTTLYPLDVHNCNFQFIVSNHRAEELIVQLPTRNIDRNGIKENGEWYIENTKSAVNLIQGERSDNVSVHMVEVSFTLRRRPTFSIINTYTPLTLMTSLNIATCFVRPDSGERLSFAVTLYLSLVFATTAAIEEIPNNSLKMPYMSYEILIINLINTIGVTWSIFIVHLANVKEVHERKIPNLILKMVRKRKKRRRKIMNKIECNTETEGTVKNLTEDQSDLNQDINQIEFDSLKNIITGQEVAEAVDIVYFWLVFLSIFMLYFFFITIIVAQWAQS